MSHNFISMEAGWEDLCEFALREQGRDLKNIPNMKHMFFTGGYTLMVLLANTRMQFPDEKQRADVIAAAFDELSDYFKVAVPDGLTK